MKRSLPIRACLSNKKSRVALSDEVTGTQGNGSSSLRLFGIDTFSPLLLHRICSFLDPPSCIVLFSLSRAWRAVIHSSNTLNLFSALLRYFYPYIPAEEAKTTQADKAKKQTGFVYFKRLAHLCSFWTPLRMCETKELVKYTVCWEALRGQAMEVRNNPFLNQTSLIERNVLDRWVITVEEDRILIEFCDSTLSLSHHLGKSVHVFSWLDNSSSFGLESRSSSSSSSSTVSPILRLSAYGAAGCSQILCFEVDYFYSSSCGLDLSPSASMSSPRVVRFFLDFCIPPLFFRIFQRYAVCLTHDDNVFALVDFKSHTVAYQVFKQNEWQPDAAYPLECFHVRFRRRRKNHCGRRKNWLPWFHAKDALLTG